MCPLKKFQTQFIWVELVACRYIFTLYLSEKSLKNYLLLKFPSFVKQKICVCVCVCVSYLCRNTDQTANVWVEFQDYLGSWEREKWVSFDWYVVKVCCSEHVLHSTFFQAKNNNHFLPPEAKRDMCSFWKIQNSIKKKQSQQLTF